MTLIPGDIHYYSKVICPKALEVFKLNVELNTDSWNAYDSYGESLLKNGQKEEAVKMYKKSVELNPNNENGKKILKEISK